MTCIIACKHKGKVHMLGDLMGSDGFTKQVHTKLTKVFNVGNFVLGYTTSFRMGQILQYNWTPPEQGKDTGDNSYIFRDVVKSLKNCFDENFYGHKDSKEFQSGEFLIGWKGRIFKMQNNLSLLEMEDFASVGCGEYHALAAMKTMQLHDLYKDEPEKFLKTALLIAEDCVSGVSAEYTYVVED